MNRTKLIGLILTVPVMAFLFYVAKKEEKIKKEYDALIERIRHPA
jgi:hypothetical protein